MSRAEYYYVFESIFYALVLAELLVGWNRMIRARETIQLYWAHLAFTVVYFISVLSHYVWEYFRNSFDLINSAFSFFLFVCLKPAALFFAAFQVFPQDAEGVDFREFFKSKRSQIILPIGILQVVSVFESCSEIVNANGMSHFFADYLFTSKALGDIWLQAIFIPFIFFTAFHKKLWSVEVIIILAIIAQAYVFMLDFRTGSL